VQLHLAQLNIGTMHQPIDHPDMAEFFDALDPVNAAGEAAPGFVWRYQTDDGNATGRQAFDDPHTLLNLTVWESVQQLRDFAYRGVHRDFFRRRAEWFAPQSETVMWWVPAGTLPTVEDAVARLEFLRRHGPSPYAFQMGQQFPALVLLRRDLHHSDAQSLIARLDAELLAATPPGGTNFFHIAPEHVEEGAGAFYVAYLGGAPRAIGAFRAIDDVPGAAEVKRMWSDPEVRGSKLGAAVLATIETAAIAEGFDELRLETGEYLTAAVGMYRRYGFEACDPWGEYVGVPLSYTMSKRLP
jgi:GNAT superfamily N-acetyltransferase